MLGALRTAAILCLFTALVGTSCVAPGSQPQTRSGLVTIPEIPLPVSSLWRVDSELISERACEACAQIQGELEAARFFSGILAAGSTDALLLGSSPAQEVSAELGNLFVSGYFGGTYLRSTLSEPPASAGSAGSAGSASSAGPAGSAGSAGSAIEAQPQRLLLDLIGAQSQAGVEGIASELQRLATAPQAEMETAARVWLVLLAAIDGYNRGYVEVLLENAPEGAQTTSEDLACVSWFGCSATSLPLAATTRVEPIRQALLDDPSPQWIEARSALVGVASSSLASGRAVWESILRQRGFSAAGFDTIAELSGGFLAVVEATLLSMVGGLIGHDEQLLRRSFLGASALVVWAGSYFLGLASPLDSSLQPLVDCELSKPVVLTS